MVDRVANHARMSRVVVGSASVVKATRRPKKWGRSTGKERPLRLRALCWCWKRIMESESYESAADLLHPE